MDTPTIYLIANNMSPSASLMEYLSNIEFRDDDMIVAFNKADSPLINLLPRIDIACFRYGGGVKSKYHGIGSNLKIGSTQARARRFFFLNDPENIFVEPIVRENNIDEYEVHKDIKELSYRDIEYKCKRQNAPTTGVFYLFHFLNAYPNHKIEMVGFDLFGDRKDNLHSFSKERDIVNKMKEYGNITLMI